MKGRRNWKIRKTMTWRAIREAAGRQMELPLEAQRTLDDTGYRCRAADGECVA